MLSEVNVLQHTEIAGVLLSVIEIIRKYNIYIFVVSQLRCYSDQWGTLTTD
jgi:hypothetical protein